MKRTIIITILIITLVAINHGSIKDMLLTGKATVNVPEENGTIDIYFCQTDDCEDELVKTIDMAQKTVHCAFYDVDLESIRDALSEQKGVEVVVDADNKEFFSGLDWVRPDARTAIMHNKFCVIDDDIVWTGSFNPTVRGSTKNDNNALRIKSKALAANYEDEFSELWNGVFGKGAEVKEPIVSLDGMRVENYFCPEDWCANKILKVLEAANESIDFMTFSFTDDDIGDLIIEKHREGVKVRGVFEKSQNNAYTEYPKMVNESMDVRWDGNPANMHHKVFIVDGKVVVTGSMNPTNNGDRVNDENVLIIYDEGVASGFEEEFERVRVRSE